MGNKTANSFPIPDLVLRDAYLAVARRVGSYREKFCSRTEWVNEVKFECGPEFAHVPVDNLRDRIVTCCKSPDRHGGGWSATRNGHGPGKIQETPSWYQEYLTTSHWQQIRARVFERFGAECCLCRSDKNIEVHHNTYANLYNEDERDCVPLCRRCHKRHSKWMVKPGDSPQADLSLFF